MSEQQGQNSGSGDVPLSGNKSRRVSSSGDSADCSKRSKLYENVVTALVPTGENALVKAAKIFHKEKVTKETNHFLAIFPEEIWTLILETLDSNNLENLSNLFPFFRRLLLPTRVLFLFQKVWNILANKYQYAHPDSFTAEEYLSHVKELGHGPPPYEDGEERSLCNDCGGSIQTRWYSEILKLRLVCRKWENTVNTFYDNLPIGFDKRHCSINGSDPRFLWMVNSFCSSWDAQYHSQFVQHFEPSHGHPGMDRNPFFGRRCQIAPEEGHPNENMFRELNNLLGKYGHHIWYCGIVIRITVESTTAWYTLIRSLLGQMPNLKVVNIVFNFNLFIDQASRYNVSADLTQVISLNPMPTMKNLEYVRTENLPALILNELLRLNSQISILHVADTEFVDIPLGCRKYNLPLLSNLKQLQMNVRSENEMEDLEKSPGAWPLEKIQLDFTERGHDLILNRKDKDFIKWPRIFTFLEKYGDTLTHVEIRLPVKRYTGEYKLMSNDNAILKECSSYKLNLPKVKIFKVKMENLSSLDFILPMKDTLEVLQVAANVITRSIINEAMYQTARRQQVIEFLGLAESMLGSNIWGLFPKLERLHVVNIDFLEGTNMKVTYTRQEWLKEIVMRLLNGVSINFLKKMIVLKKVKRQFVVNE